MTLGHKVNRWWHSGNGGFFSSGHVLVCFAVCVFVRGESWCCMWKRGERNSDFQQKILMNDYIPFLWAGGDQCTYQGDAFLSPIFLEHLRIDLCCIATNRLNTGAVKIKMLIQKRWFHDLFSSSSVQKERYFKNPNFGFLSINAFLLS